MIYHYFKNLIPEQCAWKTRHNSNFLLLTNHKFQFFVLNPVMKDIFMNANGERTVEQIVQVLQSKYDVSLSVLKKDIVHALRDLQWKRLIKLRGRKNVSDVT
jgi:hypothetical protein